MILGTSLPWWQRKFFNAPFILFLLLEKRKIDLIK